MADDTELAEIRAKRLAQLQAQKGGGGAGGGNSEAAEAQAQEQENRRQMILSRILTADARERLSRIHLVKPEKAREVEDSLIRAAQMGAIGSVVDEPQLVKILNDLSEKKTQTKVTIQRRSALDDD